MTDLSVYRGGPSAQLVAAIHAHTTVECNGTRYFRVSPAAGWRRLKRPAEFELLNQTIDRLRPCATQ